MMNDFYWARDAVDDAVAPKKEAREKLACERRLKQMERNRKKESDRREKEATK